MKSIRAPRTGYMKRVTDYTIHLMIEDGDDGADPYAKTKYRYPSETFSNQKEAARAFRHYKKTKSYDNKRIVRAWFERKTITPLGEF